PRQLIDDLAAITWAGRLVYIVFDSDAADKVEIRWAEWHLADVLTKLGAIVKVVRLPPGENDAKVGLDDFLIAKGCEKFRELLEKAEPAQRPRDDRPVVRISAEEHVANGQAAAALAHDPAVFQRGGALVQVVREVAATADKLGIERQAGCPRIVELPPAL